LGELSKCPDGERGKYDRLQRMNPEPRICAGLPDKPSCGIVRPNQGKEDQESENVARNRGQDGLGKVCCGPEDQADEKIKEQLGPQEALRGPVPERKDYRRHAYRSGPVEVAL
jgi:hypothetical protein